MSGRRLLAVSLQQVAGTQAWTRLGPDERHVVGVETTPDWECPTWFPAEACDAGDTVVSGTAEFTFPRHSGGFSVSQQLLVGDNGDLWIYWGDDFQFVCPWYSSFAEATPDNSDCTFL